MNGHFISLLFYLHQAFICVYYLLQVNGLFTKMSKGMSLIKFPVNLFYFFQWQTHIQHRTAIDSSSKIASPGNKMHKHAVMPLQLLQAFLYLLQMLML